MWMYPFYVNRFGKEPPPERAEAQWENFNTYFKMVKLPKFKATSLSEFEDWVDKAALIIRGYHLSVKMFKLLWIIVNTSARWSDAVGDGNDEGDYEELVNSVALRRFPKTFYAVNLEIELIHPPQFVSIQDALDFITKKYSRILRLRHYKQGTGSDDCHAQVALCKALRSIAVCLIMLPWRKTNKINSRG